MPSNNYLLGWVMSPAWPDHDPLGIGDWWYNVGNP